MLGGGVGGGEYGSKKLSISVQSFVNPLGYIQVKRRRASNRFTAFVEEESNGQSLSARGHGEVRCVARAKAPRTCSQNAVPLLEGDQSRINVELTNPPPPPPPQRPIPFTPSTTFSQKIYTCSLSSGEGVGVGAGKGMKIYGPRSLQKRKKNLWKTNPTHLCFCPHNDKIIL
jgi:hypothetical protein